MNMLNESAKSGNRMLDILTRLNESVEVPEEATADEVRVCDKCGLEYTGDKCPQCNTQVSESLEDDGFEETTTKDGEVAPEDIHDPEVVEQETVDGAPKTNESTRYRLTRVLLEYYKLCESEEFDKAKELLQEESVEVKLNPEGAYEVKECDDSANESAKVTLTEDDLEGIKAVEEDLDKADEDLIEEEPVSESMRSKKAFRARARRSLVESYRKTNIINAVQRLALKEGVTLNSRELKRVISEAYKLEEDSELAMIPEDQIKSAIEHEFRDYGVVIKEVVINTIDGVTVAHATLEDTSVDVYLGDVTDKISDILDSYDVDYEGPESLEGNLVGVDFYFVPLFQTESLDLATNDVKRSEYVEDEPTVKLEETEDLDDEEVEETPATEEVIEDDEDDEEEILESYAGGSANVRCKINPAFIKSGQIIFDRDSKTVFEALSESVATKSGFDVNIEVFNSSIPKFNRITPGSEVTLTKSGSYYLLKENPVG